MSLLVGKTNKEVELDRKVNDVFREELKRTAEQVLELVQKRGVEYDIVQCIGPRMEFGVLSWTQVVSTITNRLVTFSRKILAAEKSSLINGDEPADREYRRNFMRQFQHLMQDLAAYALMALAWLSVKEMASE